MSSETDSPISQNAEEFTTFDISFITSKYKAKEIPETADTRAIIEGLIKDHSLSEDSFYVMDFNVLIDQYHRWRTFLPRAAPYYAVKCNPSDPIIEALLRLGCGFDCASKEEITQVLRLGGSPEKIIFANPCKLPSHIEFALSKGIKRMTFDNMDEVEKVAKYGPDAELVLRILSDDSHSLMAFGSKFGAHSETWRDLLTRARDLNVAVIGISFHVGSGCFSTDAYVQSLKLAHKAWHIGKEIGHDMRLLDIGGGYPGTDHELISFEEIGAACSATIEELFPDEDVQVIGEPGRFFAHNTQTLVVNIYSRRKTKAESNDKGILYYVNDGVYGGFNNIFFDHQHPTPQLLRTRPDDSLTVKSTIFGPTCDSIDVVCKDVFLPELEVGEWLFFPEMGAYTNAASSSFNGFKTKTTFYVYSNRTWAV